MPTIILVSWVIWAPAMFIEASVQITQGPSRVARMAARVSLFYHVISRTER